MDRRVEEMSARGAADFCLFQVGEGEDAFRSPTLLAEDHHVA